MDQEILTAISASLISLFLNTIKKFNFTLLQLFYKQFLNLTHFRHNMPEKIRAKITIEQHNRRHVFDKSHIESSFHS